MTLGAEGWLFVGGRGVVRWQLGHEAQLFDLSMVGETAVAQV